MRNRAEAVQACAVEVVLPCVWATESHRVPRKAAESGSSAQRAKFADAPLWPAHYQSRAFEHWLERYQLDVAGFRERRAARQDLGDRDIIWGMFNESVRDLITQGDFQALKARYYGMALFVAEEDRGFTHLLTASHEMELRAYQQTGLVDEVEISTAGEGNACPACQGLDGKVFTIEEALRTMPLPCKECTMVVVGTKAGFCRCTYLPVLR